jgi:hypothetical protein
VDTLPLAKPHFHFNEEVSGLLINPVKVNSAGVQAPGFPPIDITGLLTTFTDDGIDTESLQPFLVTINSLEL